MDGCHFTPSVNPHSEALAWRVHGAYGAVPAHERLHEHGARHRARREGPPSDERFPDACLSRAVHAELSKHGCNKGLGKENAQPNRRSESCLAAEETLQGATERLHAQARQKQARAQARAHAEHARARAEATRATKMSANSKLMCQQRAFDLGLGPAPESVEHRAFAPPCRPLETPDREVRARAELRAREPVARAELREREPRSEERAPRPATVAERMAEGHAGNFHPAGLVDPRAQRVPGETIVHARVQDYLSGLPRELAGY